MLRLVAQESDPELLCWATGAVDRVSLASIARRGPLAPLRREKPKLQGAEVSPIRDGSWRRSGRRSGSESG
jgi:hypothetical protein